MGFLKHFALQVKATTWTILYNKQNSILENFVLLPDLFYYVSLFVLFQILTISYCFCSDLIFSYLSGINFHWLHAILAPRNLSYYPIRKSKSIQNISPEVDFCLGLSLKLEQFYLSVFLIDNKNDIHLIILFEGIKIKIPEILNNSIFN